MGFSDFVNKARNLADQHDEQVDQGLDRVGDEANKRLAGHESQVDGLVGKGKQYTGAGDTTAAPAAGADPAAEVPAGPPTGVPAESGEVPPQQ
jgi:antitoxin protein of toxin-antitoxin system